METINEQIYYQLDILKKKIQDLTWDIETLEKLINVDVQSSLNKVRFIAEKVLSHICQEKHVDCGKGPHSIETMLGPLIREGSISLCIPYIRTIQLYTNPGSHYQSYSIPRSHLRIAQDALVEFLKWYYDIDTDILQNGKSTSSLIYHQDHAIIESGRSLLHQIVELLSSYYNSTPLLIRSYLIDMEHCLGADGIGYCFRGRRVLEIIKNCHDAQCMKEELSYNPLSGYSNILPKNIEDDINALDSEYNNQLLYVSHNMNSWNRLIHSIGRFRSVIIWFLNYVYPYMEQDDYDIIFESENRNLTPDEFNIKTIEFNKIFFGDDSTRSDVNIYLEMNRKNPYLHLYAITRYTHDIVGALEIYPLTDDFILQLETDESIDNLIAYDEFPDDAIRIFDQPGVYTLFVDTIATHPQFRRTHLLVNAMFKKYFDFLSILLNRGICFSKIYAEAWTDQGKKLCQFFKMEEIRHTRKGILYRADLAITSIENSKFIPTNVIYFFEKNKQLLDETKRGI